MGLQPLIHEGLRVGRWLWPRRAAELVTGQAISELMSRKNIHSLFIHASAVRISICNQNNLKVIAKFYVTYKCGVVCAWYRTLVFPYILLLRFFVRYEDLLSCSHLSCFFFFFPFFLQKIICHFQTEGRILRKAQESTSYLQNPQSLFAFSGPLADYDQKNALQTDIWCRNQNTVLKQL